MEIGGEHLRRSLAPAKTRAPQPPCRVQACDMPLRPGVDISNIHELLERFDEAAPS